MENQIEYIEYKKADMIEKLLHWQKMGLMQTSSGYGAKLTTTKMLKVNNKLHRVYCACYGNSGSCYIIKNGSKLYLHDYPID
jgi:hypothetical protein